MAEPAQAGARLLQLATSFAALSADNPVRRQPRRSLRRRPAAFFEAFEDRALFYDAFLDGDGRTILLVGPPPLNLREGLEGARYTARPSGRALGAEFFPSRSTMVTRLSGAPEGTTEVEIAAFGETFILPVQPNLSDELAGARMLVSINRDNALDWIARWADWHVRLHGVDTVVLFENGSTSYDLDTLAARLCAVPGLARVVLAPMPHRFGRTDEKVLFYPYWAHFLQIAGFDLLLRRLARKAAGILDLDIDELCYRAGGSIFDAPELHRVGSARIKARWVEAVPDEAAGKPDHLAFPFVSGNPLRRIAAPKWVLDPKVPWVDDLDVHPYWHRIFGAPEAAKSFIADATMFHFRGINTSWKENRTRPTGGRVARLVRDEELARAVAVYEAACGEGGSNG